jgi:hypothetical protein
VEPNPSPSRLRQLLDWFSRNPWFGVSASLASIIGLPLAIGLYIASLKHRLLVYAVNPTTTVLVQGKGLSDLHVSYKGRDLAGTDLTAVQILLWNSGKEPIRPADILEAIRIKTPNVRIIEAQVRATSRPVIGFTLDTSHASEGIIYPQWKILEQNDGATIQLLLASPSTTDVSVSGIIEGQDHVWQEIRPEQMRMGRTIFVMVTGPIFIAGVFLIGIGFFARQSQWRERWANRVMLGMLTYVLLTLCVLLALAFLFRSVHPSFTSW